MNEKGYGVAHLDGVRYFVAGVLPGELVDAEVVTKKKGTRYTKAVLIVEKNKNRVLPKDQESYLSTSPYQIMAQGYENEIKKELIQNLFTEIADTQLPDSDVIASDKEYKYRNKFEFSFYIDAEEAISLAFHKRDSHRGKQPVDTVALAPDRVNDFMKQFIKEVNQLHKAGKLQFADLKSLVVRYSFHEDKIVYALYLKNEIKALEFNETDTEQYVKGSIQLYSDPRSPASVASGEISRSGELELIEKVGDYSFVYGYDSFFQVNPQLFAQTVSDIKEYLAKQSNRNHLYDLYSGVGTIGISLADMYDTVSLLELSEDSPIYAKKSAELNDISNVTAVAGKVEANLDSIDRGKSHVVVDPPRSGLHLKLVEKLLELKPQLLIYLSCNPKTQAEDYRKLSQIYDIKFNRAYNYYPKTPHVENLLILEPR
ncbi:MAG: hypothetical protein QY318_04555 [Candidatus Dojkabacteria bacterium]|nr:MAG: hypothetical protein QY318_04555 [Candidatus Dojkabacteria bacterium]